MQHIASKWIGQPLVLSSTHAYEISRWGGECVWGEGEERRDDNPCTQSVSCP
jgi:hypothetical protein